MMSRADLKKHALLWSNILVDLTASLFIYLDSFCHDGELKASFINLIRITSKPSVQTTTGGMVHTRKVVFGVVGHKA